MSLRGTIHDLVIPNSKNNPNKKIVPDPPCCRIPWCRKNLNDSCFCVKLGKIGFTYMDKNRKWIFRCLTVLAIIASALSVVPLVSMSTNADTVKDTFWTFGRVSETESDLFISIKAIVVDGNFNGSSVSETFLWESEDCNNVLGGDTSYCSDCESACVAIRRTVIINFITIWPTISTNLKRSDSGSDLNFTKFMAIFTGTLSSIVMLSALSTFRAQCFASLPDETPLEGLPIEYSLGPGFLCLLFPQIFKLLEVILNFITAVPPAKEVGLQEGLFEPLAGSNSVEDSFSDF